MNKQRDRLPVNVDKSHDHIPSNTSGSAVYVFELWVILFLFFNPHVPTRKGLADEEYVSLQSGNVMCALVKLIWSYCQCL